MIERALDWVVEHTFLAVVALALLCLSPLAIVGWYEHQHPCLEYGDEKVLYYVMVGKTIVPMYLKPCVLREAK